MLRIIVQRLSVMDYTAMEPVSFPPTYMFTSFAELGWKDKFRDCYDCIHPKHANYKHHHQSCDILWGYARRLTGVCQVSDLIYWGGGEAEYVAHGDIPA